MKYVILCGDGMGDYPVPELGGKTILGAADIPFMRRIAAAGDVRMVQTVPDGLPPGSDVANMGLLGYDARENYTGRAPIEAAGAGIPMAADDVALRCNLVTVKDGVMDDYSAGHITTEEGQALVADIGKSLGTPAVRFFGGVQYRHLVLWKNGPVKVKTQPPHDIAGKAIEPYLPTGECEQEMRALMAKSVAIFKDHPVNRRRVAEGHNPASQIWLWGQGRAMQLKTFREKFNLSGCVISAVDLVRGLGVLAGLDAPRVPGATGWLDTNYAGKVAAAMSALDQHNFAYIHVEAPDECGHVGDFRKKKQAIEDFDRHVVGPVWQALEKRGEPFRLIVAMDHRTPVAIRGHTREPVPLAVLDGPVGQPVREIAFDETVNGGVAQTNTWTWISELLRK